MYTEQTPTITLGHEFAEHSEEFVQNLRRNLRGLILIQVYDSVGYRTMSLWSQIYQKLYQTMIYPTTWGKHWSFLLLGSRPKLLGKRWKQCKEAGPTIQCPSRGLYRHPLCSTLPTALEQPVDLPVSPTFFWPRTVSCLSLQPLYPAQRRRPIIFVKRINEWRAERFLSRVINSTLPKLSPLL